MNCVSEEVDEKLKIHAEEAVDDLPSKPKNKKKKKKKKNIQNGKWNNYALCIWINNVCQKFTFYILTRGLVSLVAFHTVINITLNKIGTE